MILSIKLTDAVRVHNSGWKSRVVLFGAWQKVIHWFKDFIFDKAGLQEMLELREKYELEDAMGFRGQFDKHRRFQIALLEERGMVPASRSLEIGCGPLTGGIPFIEYLKRGNYAGVDVQSSVLNLGWREVGRAELSEKNPPANLLVFVWIRGTWRSAVRFHPQL